MDRKSLLWAGVTAIVFGLFWHIWYLFAGNIPSFSEMLIYIGGEDGEGKVVWTLPFSISHSWDMLIAPLFVLALCRLWKLVRHEDILLGLQLGVLVGVIFVLLGVFLGVPIGVIFVLLGMILGLTIGIRSGFSYSVTFGFICGTYYTMPVGAMMGLTVALPMLIIWVLVSGLKSLVQSLKMNVEEKSPTD